MTVDWVQLGIAFISGGSFVGLIQYFGKRWVEKHHRTEAMMRDKQLLEVVDKFIDVKLKSLATEIQVQFSLETVASQPAVDAVVLNLLQDLSSLLFTHVFYVALTSVMGAVALDDMKPYAKHCHDRLTGCLDWGMKCLKRSDPHNVRTVIEAYLQFAKSPGDETMAAFGEAVTASEAKPSAGIIQGS